MDGSRKPLIISLLLIVLGIAWLLNVLGVVSGVDWIWTLGLGAVGIAVLVAGRVNRLTFVLGLFLLTAAVLSVLRQTGRLRLDIEVPVLVIALGVLMFIAHAARLPLPQRPDADRAP